MLNKTADKKGQSIFEYFILTIIVVLIGLGFFHKSNYRQVEIQAEDVFNLAVNDITGENSGGSGNNGNNGGGFGGNNGFGGGGGGGR